METIDGIPAASLLAAARVVARLPIIPSKDGLYSFYAVLLALCEQASRVTPLGAPINVLLSASAAAPPVDANGMMGGGRFGGGAPQGGAPQGGPGQGRPDWGGMMQRFQQRLAERSPLLMQFAQRLGGGQPGAPQGAPPQGAPAPGGAPGAQPAQQPAPWMQGALGGIAQRIAAQRGMGGQQQYPVDPNQQQQPGGITPRGWGRY
jgi:hypothetical protein